MIGYRVLAAASRRAGEVWKAVAVWVSVGSVATYAPPRAAGRHKWA
jgi:hypothetical protein